MWSRRKRENDSSSSRRHIAQAEGWDRLATFVRIGLYVKLAIDSRVGLVFGISLCCCL